MGVGGREEEEEEMGRWGGAYSWSQLQPRQRIGGALLMKGCNQVAHANPPTPREADLPLS